MMQKPWFKTFIWFVSSSFFFLASSVVISELSPGPSEQQVMQFMSGMMGTMHNSLMGLSMSIEHDYELKSLVFKAAGITLPLIFTGIILGLYVRFLRGRRNAG